MSDSKYYSAKIEDKQDTKEIEAAVRESKMVRAYYFHT